MESCQISGVCIIYVIICTCIHILFCLTSNSVINSVIIFSGCIVPTSKKIYLKKCDIKRQATKKSIKLQTRINVGIRY